MQHRSEHHDNAHYQHILPRAAGYDAVLRLINLWPLRALAVARRPGRTLLLLYWAAAPKQGVALQPGDAIYLPGGLEARRSAHASTQP